MTHRTGLCSILLCLSLSPAALLGADEHSAEGVWFSPAGESPDLIELFRRPGLWSQARAKINVFKFGPTRLTAHAGVKRNSFEDLKEVDAFRMVHEWGIKIASEEEAIKRWDCTGMQTAKKTELHMRNVREAGSTIDIIALDEPLKSGQRDCHLTAVETAQRTSAYVKAIVSSGEAKAQGVIPRIGIIEPYPSLSLADLKDWVNNLIASGFSPAFVHIDINGHFVDVHPEVRFDEDLKAFKGFLHEKGIPFGVIFWSGYAPLNSDRAYYEHVMKLTRAVKRAVGRPDEVVFQSWVQRSPASCGESNKQCGVAPCSQSDPPYCGEKSIPLNLPESDSSLYSHTRLINDALAELTRR